MSWHPFRKETRNQVVCLVWQDLMRELVTPSDTKAKKLNSLCEATYRLVSTAGSHANPGDKAL